MPSSINQGDQNYVENISMVSLFPGLIDERRKIEKLNSNENKRNQWQNGVSNLSYSHNPAGIPPYTVAK